MDYTNRLTALQTHLEALQDLDISKTARYISVDAVKELIEAEPALVDDPILFKHSRHLYNMIHGYAGRTRHLETERRIIKEMLNRVRGRQEYDLAMTKYLEQFIEDVFESYNQA